MFFQGLVHPMDVNHYHHFLNFSFSALVLVAACRIFDLCCRCRIFLVVACGIFSCDIQTL